MPDPIDLDAVDFHEIARRGDGDVLAVFLDAGLDTDLRDAQGNTLLMVAAYNDAAPTTALLLARGADPDAPGPAGTPLMGLAFKGYADRARQLLDAGADPNVQNPAGASALHVAAMFRQTAVAEALLASGADAALRDARGMTPADLAAANGHTDLAERLGEAADTGEAETGGA